MTILNALKGLYAKLGGKKSPDNIQTRGEAVEDITGVAVNGSDALPTVTAEDNGDVLTVVEGAWAKAAPSGGGVYNVTAVYDDSGEEAVFVFNKTWQEIYNAMSNGKTVVISYENPSVEEASSGIVLSEGAFVSTGTQWQNGYFVRYGGGNTAKADTANGYPVCDYM